MSGAILLIDDSATLRIQVSRVLMGAGFRVVEAIDGLDALEKLKANPDIAMIFCDFNMPRMSGIEFIETICALPGTVPPIIMLTTEGNPELIKRALASGARAWMTKPFKPDMLIAAAVKLVKAA